MDDADARKRFVLITGPFAVGGFAALNTIPRHRRHPNAPPQPWRVRLARIVARGFPAHGSPYRQEPGQFACRKEVKRLCGPAQSMS